MIKTHIFVEKLYTVGKFVLIGAVLVILFQMPVTPRSFEKVLTVESILTKTIAPASVSAGEVISERGAIAMTEAFFGHEAFLDKTKVAIEKQIEFVSSRKAYPASLAVIQRHEKTIKTKAAQNGVPEDVAIGVGLLENGGSDTAVSSAGALGVYQLMPGTARSLGLTVNKSVDERKNPIKNIDAGMRYLKNNYETFGDWGLATWAYHAGEGNVSNALKRYAKANHGVTLKGMKDQATMRAYIQKHSITVHKLLSDPVVKQFTKKLKDDSSGYPFKVVATATLFKEAAKAKEVVTR
ncbi:MAG: transglycosylase SLT domain-containing protein [Candidatus Zambryskibacteria bacterium]|nr:transglycosylase SLT domain-containing protein [Candidatus Zambryskibacteria bacterium]